MNYTEHYTNLINSRRATQQERQCSKREGQYFERHHITPKCLGGSDTDSNLILLTGREHFVAHLLLWKIHGGKLFYAVWRMSHPSTTSGVRAKITSRLFEHLRETQRTNNRRYGEHHWNYGKHHSDQTKQLMRDAKLGKPSPRKGVTLSSDTKEKIRVANIGKQLSDSHKQKISAGLKKSNHPQHQNIQPFEHVKIRSQPHLLQRWLKSDEIYTTWINNGKPGYVKLFQLTGESYLRPMIKWFKECGDPTHNNRWVEWKNNV